MNITNSNLKENFEIIVQSINEADYIAIDTEFTGLSDGTLRIHYYESLEDRYQKIKTNIEKFWICQFGLATYKYIEESSEYQSRVFNFYMYPGSRELHISFSSMNFLVNNGFDMNLLFKEAINVTKPGSDNWNRKPSRYGISGISEGNKVLMDDYIKEVLEFIESSEKNFKILLPSLYIKKLFFGTHGVAARFKNLEIKADKTEPLLILFKKNGKKIPQHIPVVEETEVVEEPSLMFAIIQTLMNRKAPVIGHYMILDMALLYDHFIGPLPDTLEEFRKGLFLHFPTIFDTKYVAKTLFSKVKFLKHTSVEDLYGYCKTKKELNTLIKITIDPAFTIGSQAHDAGFDAYMTGYIFITLSKFLPDPNEMASAAGKICVQDHYKNFINIAEENIEDFNFDNVIKIRTFAKRSIHELSGVLRKLCDHFIIQEADSVFYAELHQVNDMEVLVGDLNLNGEIRVVRFIDRKLI